MKQNFVVQTTTKILDEIFVKQTPFEKESEAISHMFSELNNVGSLIQDESETTETFHATVDISLTSYVAIPNRVLRQINLTYTE